MNTRQPLPSDPETASSSELETVRTKSLTGVLRDEVKELILNGELRPGERINEAVLAQKFGVSRGPVREALAGLGQQGMVVFVRNRGHYVRSVSVEEAEDLYGLRSAIDDHTGRVLAKSLTDAQGRELDALIAVMQLSVDNGDLHTYYPANIKFHGLLVTFTGNKRLEATYRQVVQELDLLRFNGLVMPGSLNASIEEHRHMLAEIRSRNADRAARAMRNHTAKGRERMLAAAQGNVESHAKGGRLTATTPTHPSSKDDS